MFEKGPWPHFMADLAWFWPRGSCWLCNFCHVAVHVIKKLKLKINYGNYFLNLKYLKINLKIIKKIWKKSENTFPKKKIWKKNFEN